MERGVRFQVSGVRKREMPINFHLKPCAVHIAYSLNFLRFWTDYLTIKKIWLYTKKKLEKGGSGF